MKTLSVIITAAAGAMLVGCSGQNKTVNQPIWVSGNINGLQGSPCNCGGVLPKSYLKAQEKARKAQEKAARKAQARALRQANKGIR